MELRAFATVLRAALNERGISQRELARAIGCTQSAVSHYLGGRAPPPLDQLHQWVAVLRIPEEHHHRFLTFAYLAHCPQQIEDDYLRMEQAIKDLAERVADLEQQQARRHAASGSSAYRGEHRSASATRRGR